MATLSRRPLVSRSLPQAPSHLISPVKATRTTSGALKRALSPDVPDDGNVSPATRKRSKAVSCDDDKERRRQEREIQKEEFKARYTRAFPTFRFYFDLDNLDPNSASTRESLEIKVSQLGGHVDDFFSNEITHLITNQSMSPDDSFTDKENFPKSRSSHSKPSGLLRSPINLNGRGAEDPAHGPGYDLVKKANAFAIKIWNVTKFESIIERCLVPPTASTSSRRVQMVAPQTTISRQRPLTRLLQSERLHGSTERDPTQKRHDFAYFSRSSYFVLVEDMKQELATIAIHEYPIIKGRDGAVKTQWPVLHCHPHARGPFIAFDEREKRRWEKTQKVETEKEHERRRRRARMMRQEMKRQAAAKKSGDVRRSVSMDNLHRRVTDPGAGLIDLDDDGCDDPDSANASGYLASGTGGYMAASGNSVGITSTTGTTSTSGNTLRSLKLPASLRGRMRQQVITSRKFPSATADKGQGCLKAGDMGPPLGIPVRQKLLRKSRSTNTMRLPKREEGSKPGYCESCRVKFEDFKIHIGSRRHRKFAMDDANFLQLDYVLGRVKRRTMQEIETERMELEAKRWERYRNECGEDANMYV